jgi:cytochrome P450
VGDPLAQAYERISLLKPASAIFRTAAAYLPFIAQLPFPRVIELRSARDQIIRESTKLLRNKEAQLSPRKDVLSLMIAENMNAAGTVTEREMIDQVMTFLLAGHESSSISVYFQ